MNHVNALTLLQSHGKDRDCFGYQAGSRLHAATVREHADFLNRMFHDSIRPAMVNEADVQTVLLLAQDVPKLMRLLRNIKQIIADGAVGVGVSYALYMSMLTVLIAGLLRFSTNDGKTRNEPWLRDVVPALRGLLNVFAADDVRERLDEHKDSPFYDKMKKVYKAIIEFFKKLWRLVKRVVTGTQEYVFNGEVDVKRLFGVGVSHLAALDSINSQIGGPRVDLSPVPGLLKPKTHLRQVQVNLLEQHV